MAHIIGFNFPYFNTWVNPDGTLQLPLDKFMQISFTAQKDETGRITAEFRPPHEPGAIFYPYPYHVISSIKTRGGVGDKCRCPVDPTIQYTNEDLTHCLNNLHECSFIVKSPKVTKAAREYFNCPSLLGMELENQMPSSSVGAFTDSHWKSRLILGELMTPINIGSSHFISPITFALFEDSGWYEVNYEMTTKLVEGIHWGYKDGCEFVTKPCGENDKKKLSFKNTREMNYHGGSKGATRCSSNALGISEFVIDDTKLDEALPETYRYRENQGFDKILDYCPAYRVRNEDCAFLSTLYGMDDIHLTRCLELESGHPVCRSVYCSENGDSYEVSRGIICKEEGQKVIVRIGSFLFGFRQNVICRDPKIICAQLDYPHLPGSYINKMPKRIMNDNGTLKPIAKHTRFNYIKLDGGDIITGW